MEQVGRPREQKKRIGEWIWTLLPWLWTFAGMLCDIWYEIVPGRWILDSDLAAEMVMADHLNKTHRIISRDFFYSSELRVFESQWFYRLGLLLSPNDWHRARVIASVMILLAFAAITLFFAKSIGLGEYAPWLPAILMWPFGRWYLVYGLYGDFYLVYMMFAMAATGILLRLCGRRAEEAAGKGAGIKTALLYLGGFFCAFGSGLNGVKQTLVYFGPLFLAGGILLFGAGWRKNSATLTQLWRDCRAECLFALHAFLFTVVNAAGYLVNMKIFSKNYSYDSYNYMTFLDDRQYRLYDILMDFLRLFGYEEKVKVMSGRGIASCLGVVFAGIFVLCLLRLHKRQRELELGALGVLLIFECSILMDSVVYCLMGYYCNYYWLPMIPFAVALIVLELKTERLPLRGFRRGAFVALALMLPVLSYGSVKQETTKPLFATKGYPELTDFLLENGLTEGYASFWNSAVLREMSSGRIDTWALYNVTDSFAVYGWLQEKEKMETEPEGRCFLILNEERDGKAEKSALIQYGSGELIYHEGPLLVYEFESPDKIREAVEEYRKSL